MGNVYENKCLLCEYYTEENGMCECKKWLCDNSSGVSERLEGCLCFKFGFETQGYDVEVYQKDLVKRYCVDDENRLRALMQYFIENDIATDSIKVTERLGM